ncbi:ABC-type amino acid transport system, permease component [Hahella chejuensis KCTC 2396]|uniref:ABC-type amino acid transport system, permease component n=1 Tax=Hahella chejuensis (strain KCTC 2396) TaxID=349521 RepID=Q2SA65_HAHCH|nr:amino acid ABC transporter permease [Hahella chejuensis]ABC32459.1 ABC-type amino acid transport system, permease component [Hahella chejuensis KCTC 2396]
MDIQNKGQDKAKTKIWNDPAVRSVFFQVLAVGAVVAFFLYIINNALTNMEQRGITTGFAFLGDQAGFGILQSLIEYDETHSFGRTFFVGLLNTVLVAVLGIILATILGFFIGIGRLSHNWLISKLATTYIETFRNIPLLLQIFFWYFAVLQGLPSPRNSMSIGESVFFNIRGLYLPGPVYEDGFGAVAFAIVVAIGIIIGLVRFERKRQRETGKTFPLFLPSVGILCGLPLIVYFLAGSPMHWDYPVLTGFNFKGGLTIIPELIALLIALTVYTAAFIAEVVRSGIEAIPRGQSEAANALGLSNGQRLRLVIIPQAMRVIIPPMTNQYLNLTKNSSLATAIGYPDLVSVFMGTTLNQTGQAIEIIFMTMAVYLFLSLSTSALMNWYNSRIALVER